MSSAARISISQFLATSTLLSSLVTPNYRALRYAAAGAWVARAMPCVFWLRFAKFGPTSFGTNPITAFAGLCTPELVRAAGFRTHVTLHHLMDLCDLHHADISFPRVY